MLDMNKNNTCEHNVDSKDDKQKYTERTKRSATIRVVETATCLELSRDFFKEILRNVISEEFEKKLRLLSELEFFKNHEIPN